MASATLNKIESNNQIIGAFASKTDAVSLMRNLVEGASTGDRHKIVAAATDLSKVVLFYAELVGKAIGKASFTTNVIAAINQWTALQDKFDTGPM